MSQRTKRPFLNSKSADSKHWSVISSVSDRLMTLVPIMLLTRVVWISILISGISIVDDEEEEKKKKKVEKYHNLFVFICIHVTVK